MNVVEAHDVLKSQHDWYERPAKTYEQGIFANSPQNIDQNRVAFLQAVGAAKLLLSVVIEPTDFLRDHIFL